MTGVPKAARDSAVLEKILQKRKQKEEIRRRNL